MDDREHLEHVPWQDLLVEAEPEDQRRRAMYLGAGLIGAMIVGVLVARLWWEPGTPPVPTAPGDEASQTSEADVVADPEVPSLPLYSEADLMAFPPDVSERAAIVKAEWFVTDYFTADLDPIGSSEIRASLPVGATSATHPRETIDGISYVEWARAFRVEAVGDGSYRVAVAFRALAAPPDRGFTRQTVRAVEVLVAVMPDGGTTVLDLPAPIPMPIGPEHTDIPTAEPDPPAEIVAAATTQASLWGAEPRVVSAHQMGSGWRVVVTIADAAGNRWPMAVHIDET